MRFTNSRGDFSSFRNHRRGARLLRRAIGSRLETLENRTMLASWSTLANLAPAGIGTMELLTDGTVMGEAYPSGVWYKLTPSANGDYRTGTWSALATEPTHRLYMASNMLPDGRLVNVGGEYVNGGGGSWSNTGDIYNPVTNSWSVIPNYPAPQFGDDPSILLDNGLIIYGNLSTAATAFFNPTAGVVNGIAPNTWGAGPTKLAGDRSDEETWVKAVDNTILSYNIFAAPGSQKYNYATNTWLNAGNAAAQLQTAAGSELGPALSIPDGRIVQIGGNSNNGIWNPTTNSWAALASTPGGIGGNDTPGALLPNGHVFYVAGDISTSFNPPASFFDLDPIANTVTQVNGPTGLTLNVNPFVCRMLMLPTGQILFTSSGQQLYIYNGDGAPANASKPVITNIVQSAANDYILTGSQLNGISAGASYGDDAEMDSNYPIVRLTNQAGNVFYARSTNWNKTGVGVANGATSVHFALPAAIVNGGVFKVEVSGAGINSNPVFAVFMGNTTGGTVTVRQDPGNPANIQAIDGAATNLGSFPLAQFAEVVVVNRSGVAGNTINIQDDIGNINAYVNGFALDTLNVNGATTGGTWTINGTNVTRAGGVNVIYSSIFNMNVTGSSAADTMNVGDVSLNSLGVGGGNGTDQVNFQGANAGGSIYHLGSTGNDGVRVNTDNVGTCSVIIPNTQVLGALEIGNGGTVSVASSVLPPSPKVLSVTSLTMTATAKLDLADEDMIIDYGGGTPLPTVETLIRTARNGGAWNGNGITTSLSTPIIGLGAIESVDYKIANSGATTFDGITIDNTCVLVKYTYYGDSNFNGAVDGSDYARIDATFNQEVSTQSNIGGWFNGDFDYNGKVDGSDYALIDAAFNGQTTILRPSAMPPKLNNSHKGGSAVR